MITPEFLQSCTVEQINKGVAWLVASNSDIHKLDFFMISKFQKNNVRLGCAVFNFEPCTSPNDGLLIILNSRIGIKPRGVDSDWYAYQGKIEVINSNPLRAAMEVYILMGVLK